MSVAMNNKYDLAILGAGPGGYVAAIRAAQLGLSVCVVEKDTPGGVCLNWGCIPSKSLIHHATEFSALKSMERFGVRIDRSGFQYSEVHARSRIAAKTLANGVSSLLRKNKIDVVKATGSIANVGKIELKGPGLSNQFISAKKILIATGSRPMSIPEFNLDEKQVLSSSGILSLTALPKALVILGAGAIGCEFAYVMNAFGVKVTLVEMGDHILPSEDHEVAQVLDTSFRKAGIDIFTKARATSRRRTREGVAVSISIGDKKEELKAEKILAAFGRSPNTEGIGLESVGVKTDTRGYIATGDYYQTSVPGIFAIGDVTTTPALAHVASREGEIAVEYIAGHASLDKQIDSALIPSAVYCEPQIAGFGLREDRAMKDGIAFNKSTFPYRGAGKSVAIEKTEGLVKVLTDPVTGELLGAHIVGHCATELIHELLLAKSSELLAEDVAKMIHAHPTLSESIMEAARGVYGRPIHI
ncbi:Dihydrolipoyl dehydrogenase [Georgfuchsia toluolica]|uniref:Dihydrolipoyl dehydrogenase n=2 Tax=Georgfuchsia toluolica TaxID=424218 RepID=A0A916J5B5_9PROT|nr:Dihydrolipoyl dehydrogenase [Georgfuchsia toluolica]